MDLISDVTSGQSNYAGCFKFPINSNRADRNNNMSTNSAR